MARRSPAEKLRWIQKTLRAWEHYAPRSSFYCLTLAEFKAAVRPSQDIRTEIDELEYRLAQLILQRDSADRESMRLLRGVAAGVKGDRMFGDDSALYAAMGYVRTSARRRRRKRK